MSQGEIGKVEKVPITDVWRREAVDFTPWLAKNLNLLAEELGTVLELEGTEVSVGGYSLDILARDSSTTALVAIENQITSTDHSHLGQLLTYAAGMDAGMMVWVATEFSGEHKAALKWLNEGTKDSLHFFAVEVEAVRIGDSLPAPIFRLVTAPEPWPNEDFPTDLSKRQLRYIQYWKPLLEEQNDTRKWGVKTDNKENYFEVGSGLGDGFGRFGRSLRLTWDGQARVELLFKGATKDWNKAAFDLLRDSKEQIEGELGPMIWERLDDAKLSRVVMARRGSIDGLGQELDEIRAWMIDNVNRFPETFRSHLEGVLAGMEENG